MLPLFRLGRLRFLQLPTNCTPYHNRALLLTPGYLYNCAMAESPKTGQVHSLPQGELELPSAKKPKIVGAKSESKRARKRRMKRTDLPELCSTEDVLWRDVIGVLGQDAVDKAIEEGTEFESPFEFHQEVEVEVASICSNGKHIIHCL